MCDYSRMRMMELAGIKHEGVLMEDSQVRITADDVQNDADDEARLNYEIAIEKNVKLIARRTGVNLVDNHPVAVIQDVCEVNIDTGAGMPLSHLLQFANEIAAAGLGSDVKIQGSDLFITITFKLV